MDSQISETKQIASALLAAMLSNPHVYSQLSDEGISGQLEQRLIIVAIEMAESLTQRVEANQSNAGSGPSD